MLDLRSVSGRKRLLRRLQRHRPRHTRFLGLFNLGVGRCRRRVLEQSSRVGLQTSSIQAPRLQAIGSHCFRNSPRNNTPSSRCQSSIRHSSHGFSSQDLLDHTPPWPKIDLSSIMAMVNGTPALQVINLGCLFPRVEVLMLGQHLLSSCLSGIRLIRTCPQSMTLRSSTTASRTMAPCPVPRCLLGELERHSVFQTC